MDQGSPYSEENLRKHFKKSDVPYLTRVFEILKEELSLKKTDSDSDGSEKMFEKVAKRRLKMKRTSEDHDGPKLSLK